MSSSETLAVARAHAGEVALPTLEEVKSWPASVDIPRACLPYGISRSQGYRLAAEGTFPAKVLKVGGRYRVITASIVRALSETE